jgi:hypothetical protein
VSDVFRAHRAGQRRAIAERCKLGPADRKETDVAGRSQPSFLKRQKEQQRRARADEKRLQRLKRRRDKSQAAVESVPVEAEIEADEPQTPE